MAIRSETKPENVVLGKVTDKLGRPLANLVVRIYDRDMRREELLGECLTDRDGKYEVAWSHSQLSGRGKKTADLAVEVVTRERKHLLFASDVDDVRFNASPREQIDVTIERPLAPDVVEYDHIVEQVSFLAGAVPITDLQESREHRDVTFLSREAEIPAEKIEHVVVAHRLEAESKIDAAFFYALLRENTLLKSDLARPVQTRLSIGIHTDTLPLLYDAALVDETIIHDDVAAAVEDVIVSEKVLRGLRSHVKRLRSYRKRAEELARDERPKKLLRIVSRFVLEDKISEMGRLFEEHRDDPAGFFGKLNSDTFFSTDEKAGEARASVVLDDLLGLEETVLERIRKSHGITGPEDVRSLAKLDRADWTAELRKLSVRGTSGRRLEKGAADLLASSLVRKMERAYPTAAFAAQLGREQRPVLKHHEEVSAFLSAHEDFDLLRHDVSTHLKDAGEDSRAVREELKSVQRVFKLVPHYGKTMGLRKLGIHSSQAIAAAGETRFVGEIAPKAGISAGEAREVFAKAQRTATAAMLIAGELQDTVRAMDVPAMEMKTLSLKLEAVGEDFPNLKSLFQSADSCACTHCRSVYSPAAYLVEILQFLDKRSVTDLSTLPPTTGHLAKDVLFERRPDLGDVDLSCENANTPVPYIDLVCELLEEAISPDPGIDFTGVLADGADPSKGRISNALLTALQAAGLPVTDRALILETESTTGASASLPHYLRDEQAVCKIVNTGGNDYEVYRLRQTLSPAEELAAAPEYVNAGAYTTLKGAEYAFELPFDLDHAEAKAYFARFDVSRAELMKAFQTAGSPADEAIAAETLGLTAAERTLITTPAANLADQQSYWNAPAQWDTPPVAGDVLDYMARVDHVLDKTGLGYEDLELLLALGFIDPADDLFIRHLDLGCDTAKKEIANLDVAALDRVHRFLRLQKKTGWKLETLDEVVSHAGLGNGTLDDACLARAAELSRLAEKTGIPVDELIGFYGEIPHTVLNDDSPKPLYHRVFLNKARNGFIDEGLMPGEVDGSQPLAAFETSIAVGLQVKERDLETLLPLLPDGDLTFANLSRLFAVTRLMKKLKLGAEDYVLLAGLSGIDASASPSDTLKLVEAADDLRKSPLKLADVRFMLEHAASDLADREIEDDRIREALETLQQEYQANFAVHRSAFDANLSAEEQKATLQTALSRLRDVGEDDVKVFIGFVDRNWTSANDAKTFTDAKLAGLFATTSIKAGIDALAAAPGPDVTAEQKDLVQAFLDSIAGYQLEAGKRAILEQTLTTSFKTAPELVKVVLTHAVLKQPLPGTSVLADVLTTDTLIDTDVTHPVPVLPAITAGAFPEPFRAWRLAHKLFPLIAAFDLEDRDVDWFFEHNEALGWFEWDGIPYQAGQAAIAFPKYIAFVEIVDLLKRLTPVPNPADVEHPVRFFTIGEMLLPGSGATRSQLIEAFSLLTGYAREDVDAIDAHLFPAFDLADYRDPTTWKAVSDCAELMRKLGATVAQVQAFILPTLTSGETKLLRAALKARYDEDTWLATLEEIMDAIRPQKRDALVAYLLAQNPGIETANDLYDHFLVDVEMEACMPSSRIVQAHGTIQLFVQRCLMGLEPKAAAAVDGDVGWEQWKWLKNYRVWEANRKVFLYPENWIEAELRDDKSFLFEELENQLQQNELTELTAEDAFIRYLEKLDDIAFLEVAATWYQSDIKTMHVFARTKGGEPAIYYYRRFEKERYWTPWEKVELDITGDHLLAFVRNDRLCLAWPVFTEEPDPDPTSTIPNSTAGTVVDNDKPKRKLKIELAISELANKRWQPKKISKDGIRTPSFYTSSDSYLRRDPYNLMYFEYGEQVWLFTANLDGAESYPTLAGIFDIAGCKGYPELAFQGNKSIPDFFPDFKDTWLKSQRYHEQNVIPADELSVRNVISFFAFYDVLRKTPGTFRLSYPHQFTLIDLVALLYEYLLLRSFGSSSVVDYGRGFLKIPLGTLLPYFKEDSEHAYAVVPGFYETVAGDDGEEQTLVQRTGSDAMQLIEDVVALFNEYLAKYRANPDLAALLQELVADVDYQKIVAELQVYRTLSYGEQFKNLYHPLICSLRKTLYREGVPALMKRETQLQETAFDFEKHYEPNEAIVPKTYVVEEAGVRSFSYPVEDLDFSSDGAYSGYNWELFFHVPFLVATRLTRNQRFEEALTWFHYMFNPTGALAGDAPEKYWVTKPFFLTHAPDYVAQRIDTLLHKIADPTTPERKELELAVSEWRTKPFKPHVVARFRPVAYQKALLMKYIDNLTEWGDHLFRQDTMESIAQATQMYILADKLLGPKPRRVPAAVPAPVETYNQIEAKLDAFGSALIDLENVLPDLSVLPEGGAELPPPPVTLSMLYFCIPPNDKMLESWDRIADRLFKIRHCQNIEGVERSLALFAPPIDPGMLVRAAAAGLSVSDVVAGVNAPVPSYRFTVFAQKAAELAAEVRSLGMSLLQVLERKDAEAMSLLHSDLELKALSSVRDTKRLHIQEAQAQIDMFRAAKAIVEEKDKYYANIQKIISKEQLNLDKLSESHDYQMASQIIQATAAALALIPDFAIGASGFGGSPHAAAKWGGTFLAHSATAASSVLTVLSTAASYEANRASILGGYDRRHDEWKLQERVAKKELAQLDKQIAAATIRMQSAEAELANHEVQIESSKKSADFMRSKFTNKELYDWMIGQISAVYFRSYQLAHDFAKKAERCYRFELGNGDSFVSYGYWDSMKKGLQSADSLTHDIKRMQTSYLEKNKREYEITKHISLAQLDPLALVRLRATASTDFEVPEVLYDMDHPGHYFRRLKSVAISLPCVVGSYTSVSAKLSLVSNRYRKNVNPDNAATTGYLEDPGNDERFVYNVGAIQSIAASNSQNDHGLFELSFKDERYLPFEGCGAVSSWRLELPRQVRQFNYGTISDVILHVKYTAREGGSSLRGLAEASLNDRLDTIKQQLNQSGLHLALNLKQDLPNEWLLLKGNGTVSLTIDKSRLPYMAQTLDAAVEDVMFVAKVENDPASFTVDVDGEAVDLARVDEWKLCRGISSDVDLETAFDLSVGMGQLSELEELMLVVKYSF
jgi:hypothetical protein